MPDIINAPTVDIMSPTGPKTVANPLLTYKFPPGQLGSSHFLPASDPYDGKFTQYPNTLRDAVDGVSRPDHANAVLRNYNFKNAVVRSVNISQII